MRLWVSDLGGVSDEEREIERWMPVMARRLWVEAGGGGEALHHSIVREREIENEKARESPTREKMRKKMIFFLIIVFLIFLITKKINK